MKAEFGSHTAKSNIELISGFKVAPQTIQPPVIVASLPTYKKKSRSGDLAMEGMEGGPDCYRRIISCARCRKRKIKVCV